MARKTTIAGSIAVPPRKVFVDTGGWYGVISEADRKHDASVAYFRHIVAGGAMLLTSDYILDETLTRLRYDFGHGTAMAFWEAIADSEASGSLSILRVDEAVWVGALDIFDRFSDQDLSFTDCTSFVLAQRERVDEVFGFDHHFRVFGLILQPEL